MKLLHEQYVELKLKGHDLEATFDSHALTLAPSDHLKIFISGELAAQGTDRRFLLRINGTATDYQSFVVMDGHAGGGEWDGRGFYVGRNGWGLDASIGIEYTISSANIRNKRVGHGMSTFAHGNNSILGYHCNGFLVSNTPIQSIQLAITGGVFSGAIKLYTY